MAPIAAMKAKMGAAGDNVECAEPEVADELQWIWRGFWRLNECRTWLGGGMGAAIPAPISFSDIFHWCEHYSYDDEMTYLLDGCVREMDRIYIQHVVDKAKK